MRYRVGEFVFDGDSGELTRDGEPAGRMPPQPAALFRLLLDAAPTVVSREAIRDALWPDVRVEFEQGLHFAIRQIRTALGDDAAAPRYVENVPRRGYRVVAEVGREDRASRPRRWPWVAVAIALTLLLLVVVTITARVDREAGPTRVAIMPFEPPDGSAPNPIAETLLERLHDRRGATLEILGPTTTEAYDGDAQRLRALVDDFDVDWIVNGRRLGADYGDRYIAEIIRASDGAHVWVETLEGFPAVDPVVERLLAGVDEAVP